MKTNECKECRCRHSAKRLISILLSLAMLLSITAGIDFSAFAKNIPSSGQCGDNVTYTYDSTTGLLTISGNGKMTDYGWGDSPFYNSSVKKVVINYGVTSIGDRTFYSCESLISITIPNSVTSIGDRAFQYCTSLTSITIPNSVTSIGDGAFDNCESLSSITIPDSVTSIGVSAFYNCESLSSITIPDSVTSIGVSAFYNCKSLTSITIPNSVTSIGGGAFEHCTNLTSITIPNSVTSIGYDAFYECSSLTSITIPNSVTSIGICAFYHCESLTSITIPNSVTSIGDGTFAHCESLTSIVIPNSVTSIGDYAFRYCTSLTSVTIPNSVTSIGYEAFDGCTSLKDVYYSGSSEQWNKINIGSYNSCLTSATIHYNYVIHDHNFTYYVSDNNATCLKDGTKTAKCNGCNETSTITDEGSALGHNYVTDAKIEPTCTATGLTEGKHCSICNIVLVAQTTIPATGHTYSAKVVKPTYKSGGYTLYTCTCGNSYKNKATKKLTLKTPSVTTKVSKKNLKISYKKITGATGYEIQYSKDKNFKKGNKTYKQSATSKTIKKLKKGTYYVRVRAYNKDAKSSWSAKKTVKIK